MRSLDENLICEISEYIGKFQAERGYSPSQNEIVKRFNITAPRAYRFVHALKGRGIIELNDDGTIAMPKHLLRYSKRPAPIIEEVRCDEPTTAIEDYEGVMELPAEFTGDGNCFILRAKGDDMVNAGVVEGDYLVIREQAYADSGDIVVAIMTEFSFRTTVRKSNRPFPNHKEQKPTSPSKNGDLVKVCDLNLGDVFLTDEGKKATVSRIEKSDDVIKIWTEETPSVSPIIYKREIPTPPRPGMVLKKVTNVFRGETYEWLHIEMSTGEELKCTREHPFSVKGKGWVPAIDLQPEDQFLTADGRECSVIKTWIETLDKPETTYNIEVEGCHNYFVGESGVLVHNVCVAKEGKLRAVVKNGGDPNHLNTGHAHILDGSTDVASVLKDGSVFAGKLTPKTATFVNNHLTEIAEGIDKFYWIGRIKI